MSIFTSPTARTIVGVVLMSALLALYLWLTLDMAIAFLRSGQIVGIIMGCALFVLPVIGAWGLVRELMFGVRSGRLTRILAAEGGLPEDTLPHRPSGRTVREAADEVFPVYAEAVDAEPESWRAWFRLGLAYDACGDRRRARSAIRQSIKLYRA